jgi:hypothetical protein
MPSRSFSLSSTLSTKKPSTPTTDPIQAPVPP